jgi:hypothetical protein
VLPVMKVMAEFSMHYMSASVAFHISNKHSVIPGKLTMISDVEDALPYVKLHSKCCTYPLF